MANDKSARGRAQDRSKVAGGQGHEVAYQATKSGASAAEVKQAIKKVGNSRKKVEGTLSR